MKNPFLRIILFFEIRNPQSSLQNPKILFVKSFLKILFWPFLKILFFGIPGSEAAVDLGFSPIVTPLGVGLVGGSHSWQKYYPTAHRHPTEK